MKIGFVQMKVEFGKKEKNLLKAQKLLNNEEADNADIIVLPELFNTGYLFTNIKELEDLSESADSGDTIDFLSSIAKEKNLFISYGYSEKEDNKFYNSSNLIGPNGLIGTYRKIHLFYEEKLWFEAGKQPPEIYTVKNSKISMMICFDWIFPETARMIALQGGQIILHSANLVLPYCQNAMTTRSIENRIFTVTSNRIGSDEKNDKKLDFTGQSQITDTKGNILYRASDNSEELKTVKINPEEALDKNINEYNHLFKDRMKEMYKKVL